MQRGVNQRETGVDPPTPAPVVKPTITVDTLKLLAQRRTAQQSYSAVQTSGSDKHQESRSIVIRAGA